MERSNEEKWLHGEVIEWEKDGIINGQQLETILTRYNHPNRHEAPTK